MFIKIFIINHVLQYIYIYIYTIYFVESLYSTMYGFKLSGGRDVEV